MPDPKQVYIVFAMYLFLILSFVLFSKLFKTADNNASVGTIVDEY